MKAGRQNVLKKASDELVAGHGFAATAAGRPVGVAEAHARVGDAQDAIVGNGDAESIAGEIIERGLLARAPRRDVRHPRNLPDMARQSDIRAQLGEGVAETGAGQGGERRLGEQEGFARGMPVAPSTCVAMVEAIRAAWAGLPEAGPDTRSGDFRANFRT